MHPLLRYSLLPFLLLFNISIIVTLFAALSFFNIWSAPAELVTSFLAQFGTAGTAAWGVLAANAVITGLVLLIGVPLYFLRRDIRQTVTRFGVFETALTVDPSTPYEDAAREIFTQHPETAIFCYGHTHRPGMQEVAGGLLVNTGTWLKRLHRRDGIIGILPPVFYPSYQLYVVRIAPEDAGVAVEYELIEKPSPKTEELTRTERFLTVGREPEPELPEKKIIE